MVGRARDRGNAFARSTRTYARRSIINSFADFVYRGLEENRRLFASGFAVKPDVSFRYPDVSSRYPDVFSRYPDVSFRYPNVSFRYPDLFGYPDVYLRYSDVSSRYLVVPICIQISECFLQISECFLQIPACFLQEIGCIYINSDLHLDASREPSRFILRRCVLSTHVYISSASTSSTSNSST